MVSDRFSVYNYFPLEQRQLCWAHVIRDLTAIAERSGASAEIGAELLALQQQLFAQWHHYKDGTIDWPTLQQACGPIRQTFVARLQRVVELGHRRGERTPCPPQPVWPLRGGTGGLSWRVELIQPSNRGSSNPDLSR